MPVIGCHARYCGRQLGALPSDLLNTFPDTQACFGDALHGLSCCSHRQRQCTSSVPVQHNHRLGHIQHWCSCALDDQGMLFDEDAHRICSSRTCHSTSCCVNLRDASRCELSCSKRLGHSALTAADTFTVSSTSAVACAKVPAVTHGVFEDAETTFAAISRSDDGTQSPQVAV